MERERIPRLRVLLSECTKQTNCGCGDEGVEVVEEEEEGVGEGAGDEEGEDEREKFFTTEKYMNAFIYVPKKT